MDPKSKGRFAEFLARLRGAGGANGALNSDDAARFAAVLNLNRSLAQAADRRAVLQLLLDEAVELFRAERGFLVEASAEGGGFGVVLARNLDREPVRSAVKKISSTIVRQCLDTGRGVFVEDAQTDGELSAAQSIADMQLRSVLCVPLLAGGNCSGCLYLDHRFHSGVFGAEHLPWAQALADQGAIALRLYGLLELQAEGKRAVEARHEELVQALAISDDAGAAVAPPVDRVLRREDLKHTYSDLVGSSPRLVEMLRMLDRIAAVDFAVLLVGESGTGKELVASALHRHSRRADGAFVAVNVAAISPGVLESELFGHVQGAFTGADESRLGLLRRADGGVLFLDEVTEMPLEMQVKLLRFLEDRRVRPVGSDEVAEVDLRVIAATNRDPRAAVAEGVFREDLYYRLSAMTVAVPALRDRREDIPELAEHFLGLAAADRNEGGAEAGTPRTASPGLLQQLVRRSWPGNVRQLRNELLRLDALATGDEVDVEHLAREEPLATGRETLNLRALEEWAVDEALRRTDGNKAEAARMLGISRRALYNKLERRTT